MNGYVGISAMSLIDLHGTRLQYYKYANPQMCMDLIDNINKSWNQYTAVCEYTLHWGCEITPNLSQPLVNSCHFEEEKQVLISLSTLPWVTSIRAEQII